jgi:MinD-like ATPase involved in chromosome partitioning or flagellar assembly
VDLPTYTNIWRIEKRLYKLYDLRLPMPLPLVQIGVFIGVFVPWIVLLRLVGIPFGGGWILPLYLVPPAVLTYLATRPVIEGKRLTELLLSQSRYLTEPRTWCRLTPIREPAEVVVVARVWRRTLTSGQAGAVRPSAAEVAAVRGARKARKARRGRHAAPRPVPQPAYRASSAPSRALPAAAASGAASPTHPPQLPEHPPRTPTRIRVTAKAADTVAPPSFGETTFTGSAPAPPRAYARAARPAYAPAPPQTPAEPPPAEVSERPPATPELEVPPEPSRPPEPEATPSTTSGDESRSARSGKRGLVSGVMRPAGDGETWQPISITDAQQAEREEPEQAETPEVAEAAEVAGLTEVAEVAPENAEEAPAPKEPVTQAEEARAEEARVEEARAEEARAEEARVEEARAEEAWVEEARVEEARAEEARVEEADAVKEPESVPRPWQKEFSRPPGEARTDALVWPPPPHRRDAAPPARSPRQAKQTKQTKPSRPPTVDPTATPPTGTPLPARPAGRPMWGRTPAAGLPRRAQGTPIKPPPPPVVPEAQEPPPAPPREGRSGPASPVRPEPRPRVQRAAPLPSPSSPAITPPDPGYQSAEGGLRRLIRAMGGGHNEIDSEYEERLQRPFYGSRHIVVLGCTGGAGQTVTALMMGHTFAQYCGEPVVAIDVNPGPGALARRTRSQTPETLTGLVTRADQVTSLTTMRRYTSRARSGLDVIAAGKNPVQALDDRDYALAFRTLDHFYSVTMFDAAAAIVARVLPYADQLVLVAPASSDAARAVQMTFEWLDGHGYDELRSRAVTVINGVSRRSMSDVGHAESVARGRCRALVRIPWDDHLSLDRSPRNELKSLRTPTRRAYLALAGVVAGGFVVVPERYQEQEVSR